MCCEVLEQKTIGAEKQISEVDIKAQNWLAMKGLLVCSL